jgi:hypothetical protein
MRLLMLCCLLILPRAVVADEAAPAITFRNHVLPVLSKAGCNSGACHGALAGEGGLQTFPAWL